MHGGVSTKFNRVQVAGLLLLIGGAAYLMGVTIGATLYPGFDMRSNWNSDLAATCGIPPAVPQPCVVHQPSSAIFTAGICGVGLAAILAAYMLFPVVRPRRTMVFLALGGAGILGAGILSEAYGPIHGDLSDFGSLFFILAAIDSFRFVRQPLKSVVLGLGLLTAVAAVILIGGMLANPAADITPLGVGGMERVYAFLLVLWLVAFGTALMVLPESVTKPSALAAGASTPAERAPAEASVPGRSAKPPV